MTSIKFKFERIQKKRKNVKRKIQNAFSVEVFRGITYYLFTHLREHLLIEFLNRFFSINFLNGEM